MYKIVKKELLAPNIFSFDVHAPRVAESAQPGQFVIVIADEKGERVPLTICDYDLERGTVTIVLQAMGCSTKKMAAFEEGEYFKDFVGPLGQPSEYVNEDLEELKKQRILFVAGGVGAAPVYPQVKWFHDHGMEVDVIVGAKTKDLIILKEKIESVGNLYIATDDGSYGFNGMVTGKIEELVKEEGIKYDKVISVGPMIMMKFVCKLTEQLGIPTVVSLNPIMVDGTGMCGACRVTIDGETKFACVDGPEFDGHKVDFNEALQRQGQYKSVECKQEPVNAPGCKVSEAAEEAETDLSKLDRMTRTPIAEQDPKVRATNFEEVCLGYTEEEAMREAKRCLNCKNKPCVGNCPVSIDIPRFIHHIAEGEFEQAAHVLAEYSALPAVCGRVCPQEEQCEQKCVLGIKGEAVAIGKLERFAADWARENGVKVGERKESNGHKVAVIGSGPAGITCAGELAKEGYDVTMFEALHEPGGVLVYGIPEFRLPKTKVVKHEVENLKNLGVKIETNVIVGRTIKVEDLLNKEGFEAVFIGSGAGLPKFMGIPGENSNGVFSANEFLTRNNLMKAFDESTDTPIKVGEKVAVIGGGNVAMDAARTALRLGSEVYIVYRRTQEELPARVEEVHHAIAEGIKFEFLTSPVEIHAGEDGWVNNITCQRMELGEPDASGRRRPQVIEGSEFDIEVDTVIMALGTSPNPLIPATTEGLELNQWDCIVADEETGKTSKEAVFAGGDAVTGAATVILAMGAGKDAAKGIDKYIKEKHSK